MTARFASAGVLGLVTLASSPVTADESPRAIAGVGVAVPVVNHRAYDLGMLVHGGAELSLGRQRWILDGSWIGLAITGARVDAGALIASWRASPAWARGLRFDVGSGLVVEVERVHLELPEQGLAMSTTRAGMPVSVAIGSRLGRWVEIELGFQQFVYFNAATHSAGIAHVSLGARL